jgi:hypothetical protein
MSLAICTSQLFDSGNYFQSIFLLCSKIVFELEDERGISQQISSNRPDECAIVQVVSSDPVVGKPPQQIPIDWSGWWPRTERHWDKWIH